MSAEATVHSVAGSGPITLGELVRQLDRFKLAVWLIVALQAIWLGVLMSRGWYYQADLANLAQATGKRLSWSYLGAPQGGHFSVPGRFMFWVLNHVAPLNYPMTIVLRLIGQAVCTALLARLLVLLVGARRTVLVALALYSVSPFLIQGTLWLSASLGVIGSQFLLLGAISHHVRYAVSRRTMHAVATTGFVLAATLVSEEAAVTVLALPILSLCFLTSGSMRQRVRATLSYWREWLPIVLLMIGYLLYYFSGAGGYGVAAHPLTAGHAARVIGVELSNTVAPGLVGGPWTWFAAGDNYLSLSAPSALTQAICCVAALLVVAACVRVQGWRALAAWSMPALISAVGIVVVAVGRYDAFGIAIAQQFEHAYHAAIPAAIALCLGFCGVDINAVRARADGFTAQSAAAQSAAARPPAQRRRRGWRSQPVIALAVGAVVLGSLVSGVTYTQVWARSPTRDYVTALERSLRAAGHPVALYDTAVPSRIIPLESAHYVSDVVGLTGAKADFGYGALRPSLIDGHGHLAPARFYVQTDVDLSGPQFCRFPVQGSVTVTKSFRAVQRANNWYLQITYFEQHAALVKVTVIDRDGTEHHPVYGSRELLHSGLGGIHLLFRGSAPEAVRVASTSPATNLCITSAQIGFPYIAKKAGS